MAARCRTGVQQLRYTGDVSDDQGGRPDATIVAVYHSVYPCSMMCMSSDRCIVTPNTMRSMLACWPSRASGAQSQQARRHWPRSERPSAPDVGFVAVYTSGTPAVNWRRGGLPRSKPECPVHARVRKAMRPAHLNYLQLPPSWSHAAAPQPRQAGAPDIVSAARRS